jgi:hypothetical protein
MHDAKYPTWMQLPYGMELLDIRSRNIKIGHRNNFFVWFLLIFTVF